MTQDTTFWPLEIHLDREARVLEIAYDDGRRDRLEAELLRVESPSAEVQGHGEGKTTVSGKRWVGIRDVEAVGNYAIRIHFDDGHDSGIYSWRYLRYLANEGPRLLDEYLAALAEQDGSRDF